MSSNTRVLNKELFARVLERKKSSVGASLVLLCLPFLCKMTLYNLVCFLLFLCFQLSKSVDVSFTLSIPPRRRDCYHEKITQGAEYEVEYQVVNELMQCTHGIF